MPGSPLDQYKALTPSSSGSDVGAVLNNIVAASPVLLLEDDRKALVRLLLADLKACAEGQSARVQPADAAKGLLALKMTCRIPAGSEILVERENLVALRMISGKFRDQGNMEAADEALKCVANALLLVDTGRTEWVVDEVGGGPFCIDLLDKSTSSEQLFLAARILFLCTASTMYSSKYIIKVVETPIASSSSSAKRTIVDVIAAKLDVLRNNLLAGVKMSKEAMVDLLKLAFNLLVHYPKLVEDAEEQDLAAGKGKQKATQSAENKVMGDYWSPRLNGLLPPLLRTFNQLPPSFPSPIAPPLTHVIHCLIIIPASNSSLASIWFPTRSSPKRSGSASTPREKDAPGSGETTSSESSSTTGSKPAVLDRALNMISGGRRSASRSSSPSGSHHGSPPPLELGDTLQRAYDLLTTAFAHFLPDAIDPDDESVRERVKKETDANGSDGGALDHLLSPLVVLLTRLAIGDDTSRIRLREWLLPENLDRSPGNPLESRPDLLGRCLRLLSCVHHQRMKEAVGEMIYTICDGDGTVMSAQIGYGNAAGFLFNKGILSAPPPPPSSTPAVGPSSATINPITGIETDNSNPLPEMTDEEKEREAEKLFVLFERLERTGGIQPGQNPIRNAIQSGRLQQMPEKEDSDDD